MASTSLPPRIPAASPSAAAGVGAEDESLVAGLAPTPATTTRSIPRRITAADFSTPDAVLRLAYPCAFDATSSTGLGPLRKALRDWVDALLRGRSSIPTPTSNTPLLDLLRWGTAGCFPSSARGLGTATKRRRSLAQFVGLADDRQLGSISADDVVALGVAYRASRPGRPGAQISADLTELRHLLNEARTAAGLPPLGLPAGQGATARASTLSGSPWPASGAWQPSRPRALAMLGDVEAAMRTALTMQRPRKRGGPRLQVRWLAAFLALQLAVPLIPSEILALRRSNIAGDRVVIPATATTSAECYGLPEWASDALDAALPGWSSLPPDALLFPGRRGKPRTDLARVLDIVTQAGARGEGSGDDEANEEEATHPAELTPSAVRRLGQAIHRDMGAPRGVVRGSMGALSSAGAEFDKHRASEEHALNVVRSWRRMPEPPGEEGRTLPARARAGCAPSEAEFDPLRTAEPPRPMPESCEKRPRVDGGPPSSAGAGAGAGLPSGTATAQGANAGSARPAGTSERRHAPRSDARPAAPRSPRRDGQNPGPAVGGPTARAAGPPPAGVAATRRRESPPKPGVPSSASTRMAPTFTSARVPPAAAAAAAGNPRASGPDRRASAAPAGGTPRSPWQPAAPGPFPPGLREQPPRPAVGRDARDASPAKVPADAVPERQASQSRPRAEPQRRPEQPRTAGAPQPPSGSSRVPEAKPDPPNAGGPARPKVAGPAGSARPLPTMGVRPPAGSARAGGDDDEWPGDDGLGPRWKRGGR